jgi:hypothetical protein
VRARVGDHHLRPAFLVRVQELHHFEDPVVHVVDGGLDRDAELPENV